MKKSFILILLISAIGFNSIAQSNSSSKKVLKTIYWLRDNPVKMTKPKFSKKYSEVLGWLMSNRPDFQFNTSGLKEFMDKYESNSDYEYTQEITLLYTLGQVAYEIETNKKKDHENAGYYSIKYILEYYQNLLKLDENLKNELLENYLILEKENKLEEHIKELI